MMLLIDTDVFLRAFRDSNFLELIKPFNPTVCTVVNIEAIQGSKSKAEIKRLEKFIQLNFFRVEYKRRLKSVGIGASLFKQFRYFAWRCAYRCNGDKPKSSAFHLQPKAFPLPRNQTACISTLGFQP